MIHLHIVLLIAMLLSVTNSFCDREKYRVLLKGKLSTKEINELVSRFSISDATDLIELVREQTVPLETRVSSMKILSRMQDPRLFESLVNLYQVEVDRLLDNSKYIGSPDLEKSNLYTTEARLFKLCLQTFGQMSTGDSIQYLKNEFEKSTWSTRNIENYSEDFFDDQIRLKVFIGLAEAAIKTPDLYPYLEKIEKESEGMFKMNVSFFIYDSKERSYQKNPDQLPSKGYFLELSEDPQKSIYKMRNRIRAFYEDRGFLPEKLDDLIIPNGGKVAFIYGDKYNENENHFLLYKMVHGIKNNQRVWTYMLLSVGPNGKIDLDLGKFRLGINHGKAEQVFGESGDDIYGVWTY